MSSNSNHTISFTFRLTILGKVGALLSPCYELNCTTTVLLQRWLWHWNNNEGWYTIKQRNQTKPNLSNTNNLHTVVWFQVFLSNVNNYMVSTNHFYFIIIKAVVISILLYGCTTWTLTKRLEKKLDSNYTRMLRAILNKSWRQHPTKYQLYGHLPPIMKTIQVRSTKHAGHCWRSRDELISDVLLSSPYTHIWPSKSRTTSLNLHTAALWGYGM